MMRQNSIAIKIQKVDIPVHVLQVGVGHFRFLDLISESKLNVGTEGNEKQFYHFYFFISVFHDYYFVSVYVYYCFFLF